MGWARNGSEFFYKLIMNWSTNTVSTDAFLNLYLKLIESVCDLPETLEMRFFSIWKPVYLTYLADSQRLPLDSAGAPLGFTINGFYFKL